MNRPTGRWKPDVTDPQSKPGPPFGPAGAEPDLRALERALDRLALESPPPPGLAERVYLASVALLPGGEAVRTSALPAARRAVAGRIQVWARLALAASIVLAFILYTMSSRPAAAPSADEAWVLLEYDAGVDPVAEAADPGPGGIADLLLAIESTFGDVVGDLALAAGTRGVAVPE